MFKLNEDSLNAIHHRLTDGLPAWIDRVNETCVEPAINIEQMAKVYDFIPSPTYLQDFPVVAVGDGTIDFDDDVGWSATGVFDFIVVTWIMDYDQRILAWKLRRTMTAIANCLLQGRSLANEGGGWGMTLGKIEPGPVLGRRENPAEIVGMRALTLRVRDEQDSDF